MFDRPITFDSFIRGVVAVLIIIGIGYVLNLLSGVLLPFFLAWLMAYLLYPLVSFLQYRCHLRFRVPCILLAFLLVLSALAGLCLLIIPPTIEEFSKLSGLLEQLSERYLGGTDIAPYLSRFFADFADKYQTDLVSLVHENNIVNAFQGLMGQAWELLIGALGVVIGLLGSAIVLLYMFFILMDYEGLSKGWVNFIPKKSRGFAVQLAEDMKNGMNAYFRGQSLIAFLVGILFSIGFLIIDFPLAIGLGMFIGFLNLVPYLQMVGIIPAVLLALLKSVNTGESFWWIMFLALLVFIVVQSIQDLILTPKIMGRQMGLKPAVILLSLSVWGSLLGFIGLIIALPLTTLIISYYKRFVLGVASVPHTSVKKGRTRPEKDAADAHSEEEWATGQIQTRTEKSVDTAQQTERVKRQERRRPRKRKQDSDGAGNSLQESSKTQKKGRE